MLPSESLQLKTLCSVDPSFGGSLAFRCLDSMFIEEVSRQANPFALGLPQVVFAVTGFGKFAGVEDNPTATRRFLSSRSCPHTHTPRTPLAVWSDILSTKHQGQFPKNDMPLTLVSFCAQ